MGPAFISFPLAIQHFKLYLTSTITHHHLEHVYFPSMYVEVHSLELQSTWNERTKHLLSQLVNESSKS
jgi:D-tyrosyl-tRNA(Tyr) deacylase